MTDMTHTPKLRMNAYYYSFKETGDRSIDLILSAVASAGKGSHHTDQWSDVPYGRDDGLTLVDHIQNAANNAKAERDTLKEINAELLEALILILPLAKGYSPADQSSAAKRTCQSWIDAAENAIERIYHEMH